MNRPSVVVVSGDPGGANALAPVVARLEEENRVTLHSLLYREAPQAWTKRGLPFEPLPEAPGSFEPATALRTRSARLLLTGTSYNPVEWEKRFIAAARGLGVPSIALVDAWLNYRLRFSDAQGRLSFLPDRVAVMDEAARDEAVSEGLDPSRIVVTGHPAFDELRELGRRFSSRRREEIRSALDVAPDGLLVMFASQPISKLLGTDASSPLYPGYTERTVLESIVGALEDIARRRDCPITLAVRPHVRENPDDFRSYDVGRVRVRVAAVDSRELALAADLVTGMSSVLLAETAHLGRPTVSVQPGLRLKDSLPTNRLGLTTPVYRESEIEPTLRRALSARPRPSPGPMSYSAGGVGRVVDLVYRTLEIATREERTRA